MKAKICFKQYIFFKSKLGCFFCKMGLLSWLGESSTLYFPGCIAHFRFRENSEIYLKVFRKLGINFKEIEEKSCCGLPLLEAGYDFEVRRVARRNFEILKNNNIKSIITIEPGVYKMFLKDYPEMIPDWDIRVKNIWDLILERLLKKPKLIKEKSFEAVGYHDSCYLGRYCRIFESPRQILEVLGYRIIEMEDSREESLCCGSCGGVVFVNPELANKMAYERILQAKRSGIKKLVVIGFQNYSLLRKNLKDSGVEVVELSEVLAEALGIKPVEKESVEEEVVEGEEKILTERFGEEIRKEGYYDKVEVKHG